MLPRSDTGGNTNALAHAAWEMIRHCDNINIGVPYIPSQASNPFSLIFLRMSSANAALSQRRTPLNPLVSPVLV